MKVSVVIPCYNGADYVATAVASVLAQSHADLECVVVDDASTDATPDILARLAAADPRVRPLPLARNGGAARARNAGLDAAEGDFVTLLDADDRYEPGRLAGLVALATQMDADMVADNQSVRWYPDGRHLYPAFRFLTGAEPVHITQELFYEASGSTDGSLSTGFMKPLFARRFLDRHGLRYDPRLAVGEDFHLLARLMAHRPAFWGLPALTYVYYRRRGSLSFSGVTPLRVMAATQRELIASDHARYSPRSVALASRRADDLDAMADLADVNRHLKSGRIDLALAGLLNRPGLAFRLPRAAKQAVVHRLAHAGRRV